MAELAEADWDVEVMAVFSDDERTIIFRNTIEIQKEDGANAIETQHCALREHLILFSFLFLFYY